jgi:ribulose-5-phosphate 4-epimerase/fuculose-1-phosphate aldolase
MVDEGVIKFEAEHEERRLDTRVFGELACKLTAWREVMAKTQLVGQDPARYGGAGYGNVSGRVGPPSATRGKRSFLITGTQTSGSACITLDDYCVVSDYDYHRNRVRSYGRILPSSESMTHGAIYDLAPAIRFVLHAHTPTIWRRAAALKIPTTDPKVAYGTPEMAHEVQRLFRSTTLPQVQILSMGGHEDGIIVFGRTAEEAGQILIAYLARAYETQCDEQGVGLCTR